MTSSDHIKLGIACVYFFADRDDWILDLQLDFIEKTTRGVDFTVYAAANRLQEPLRQRLAARSYVKIVDLPAYEKSGGPEHGHYLSELLKHAKSDGCSHLCTLDCDSFPMRDGWAQSLISGITPDQRVAAVFRSENKDSDLPHPCGTFLEASVLDDISIEFWPDEDMRQSETFKRYMAETGQRFDTGIGVGFALWQAGMNWRHLTRSNKTDLHFIMAGIYGDIFFHLGASSRRPAFHLDYVTLPHLRLSVWMQSKPLVWRLSDWIEDLHLNKNQLIADEIRQRLRNNPDQFIEELRTD